MEISLREFREEFHSNLLAIHWRHWTTLSVASHVKPERKWIIDLEPLIISTLAIGLHDKRLLSSSIEWLIKNGQWINLYRLKRIAKVFTGQYPGMKEPPFSTEVMELFVDTYNKNTRNKIKFEKFDSYKQDEKIIKQTI